MEPSPIAQFIDAHGGASAIAQATGKSPEAVRQWKFKKVIPRAAWPELIEAFPDVTMDRLLDLERAA